MNYRMHLRKHYIDRFVERVAPTKISNNPEEFAIESYEKGEGVNKVSPEFRRKVREKEKEYNSFTLLKQNHGFFIFFGLTKYIPQDPIAMTVYSKQEKYEYESERLNKEIPGIAMPRLRSSIT